MQKFHSLIIKDISKENSKSYSIIFEVPKELQTVFSFKAGQYVTVRYNENGKEIRRCYSISSKPTKNDTFQIIVKIINNGLFSSYVKSLQVGDRLDVSEPEGNFYYEPTDNNSNTFIAVAAGSGITPIYSIIQSILYSSNDTITLLYGNKNVEQTIFNKEITELSRSFSERFKVIRFYTQENIEDCHYGRIDPKIILQILAEYNLSSIERFYICGPEDLIKKTTDNLLAYNVEKEKISYEQFFTNTPAKQDIDIPVEQSAETYIKVTLDAAIENITVSKNVLLLDSLLDAGVDVPYSCQNAICSSCICILTKGEVRMVKNEILLDSELKKGKILVCQSYPISDEIELNYDLL